MFNFTGNCKTILVANILSDERHIEETLSTLRFASRMATVATTAVVNQHVQLSPEAELQKCFSQISELKRELAMHDQLSNRSKVSYEPFSETQRHELRAQVGANSLLVGCGWMAWCVGWVTWCGGNEWRWGEWSWE